MYIEGKEIGFMQKIKLLIVPFVAISLFAGCNKGPTHPINEEITKIEDGLYSMTLRDDYVEKYINAGGGDTDGDILDFAKKNISDDPILDKYHPWAACYGDACSSFVCLNNDNEYIHGRNLDLIPAALLPNTPSLIMHNIPKSGYESISFSTFGLLSLDAGDIPSEHAQAFKIFEFVPLDGINSAGLAVNVNVLHKSESRVQQDTIGKTDITTTVLIRLILNKAKNVDEAVKIINKYNIHDSNTLPMPYHFMISDQSGASCVVEFYNNEIQIINKRQDEKILAMTNTEMNEHFGEEWKECERYKAIIQTFNQYGGEKLTQEQAMEALKAAKQNHTTHSIIYNLKKKSVYFCRGMQWEQMHFFDM